MTARSSTAIGQKAEQAAESFLRGLGYRVLERNWRCPTGELDLIAVHGDTLVFVEVRSRAQGSSYSPEETVGPVKQRRLISAAEAYLAESSWDGPCRFDVVAVDTRDTGRTARLISDAFNADPDPGGGS